MPNSTNKEIVPFSVRLTRREREQLGRAAGDMPVGAYIRARLFNSDNGESLASDRAPADRRNLAAQILAKLGSSELSASLRDLAEAARLGALQASPETEQALRSAVRDVAAMKALLMAALRIKER